ncbi:PAS domain-containing sensor histidine kinase [Sphingomonas soli]|uniref:PAS domain-containing sensor histidine kinase n=1 Tax=Sphingomonas soli TaxID=266127 RepID=UPI000830A091|nr:PAS domain S-box protein [Sphingomonas soli]
MAAGNWPVGRKAAAGFAALASLGSILAFSGWVLDAPLLRSFGLVHMPAFPLTAIGFLFLSLGFVAVIGGETKAARLLWVGPIAIGCTALVQNLTGTDLGVDLLLFGDSVRDYAHLHPGRPGATPTTIFLLLGAAAWVSSTRRWQRDEIASAMASAVLAIGSATAVVILFTTPEEPHSQLYRISAPTALISLCLIVAYVLWQRGFGWPKLIGSNRAESRLLRVMLPAALLIPLIPALLGATLEMMDLSSRLSTRLIVMLSNIALVGLIAYWAVRRVARDQQALIETVEALRASETRLATATSAAELGVFEWNAASGRISWSPGTEERLGLAPGSMPDFDSWAGLIEPEDFEAAAAALAEAAAQHSDRFAYRYRFRTKNGDVRVVQGASHIFYNDAGELTRTVGVLVNVTEQEEREAALRGREAQLRSILDTVPDAMVVVDEDGLIRQFSATAEALWGYRAEEVIGQHNSVLAPKDQITQTSAKLAELINNQQSGATIPAEGEAADGRRFPLELRAGLARVEGKLLLTIFARDLSEQVATEERLSHLNAELAHVARLSAMSELAADLAHELNQPLSAATNFLAAAQVLTDRGADIERIGELLGMANTQTLRAGEIIRRLRAFMARGEVESRPESVPQTLREAVELILVGTGRLHIQVIYDLDPEAEWMLADRVQVQQVLVNLLRNSVYVLRNVETSARQITLRSRKVAGNMVEIEIADTGPGIPESLVNQLFSRFTTTKSERGGMGIGLSISKRIIEAHGGELKADNRPEGGASFRFTVPAFEEVEA